MKKTPPVILHCNYVEQGQSINRMCKLAARWGADGIEFRHRRGGVEETEDGYLDALKRAVDKHGLGNVLFGAPGPNLALADAGEREREVEGYIAFLRRVVDRFGVRYCNTFTGNVLDPEYPYMEFDRHGSKRATDEQWEAAVSGFQAIGDVADELGLELGFETHNVYIHDLPGPAAELVNRIGRKRVGINLDYQNILIHPDAPGLEETLSLLHGKVRILHLKNCHLVADRRYRHWIPARLGEGCINTRQILQWAFEWGFEGPVVIEAPWEGDREWFAREDLRYVRSVLEDI